MFPARVHTVTRLRLHLELVLANAGFGSVECMVAEPGSCTMGRQLSSAIPYATYDEAQWQEYADGGRGVCLGILVLNESGIS